MNFPIITICLFVGSVVAFSAPKSRQEFRTSANSPAIQKLKNKIESILPSQKKDLIDTIYAVSLTESDVLYERDPDKLVIPASVAKLFTTYAALKKMKPTATFKTTVYSKGIIKDGKLGGDLYLKGGGDPGLVSERMWMMVNELVRSGIRTITGNIVADSSYYDEEKTPESRPKYLKDQAYNAPIGALSFNFNTTTVYVKPGEAPGSAPLVYTDPENSYIDIVNQATTGKSGSKNSLTASRTEFVKGDIGDTVLLRGAIPMESGELHFYKNIVNPALYTAHMFRTFWEQRGLKMTGNILEGQVPDKAKLILEFESQPLWHVIWGMNKFSNNFVADQVLKKLGAEAWGAPGTRQKGLMAMQDALEDIGIAKGSYEMQDGSGLTRGTRVSSRQIVTVLNAIHRDFSIAPEAMASLSIAGEQGTLKRRFPNSTIQSELRAKTGTLDGVNSLAGFVTSADGELIAFAIILNDPKLRYGRMTHWIDQITLALSSFSRKS